MKFRKKPVVIDAIQLREDTILEVYRFIYPQDEVKLKSWVDHERWEDYCTGVLTNGMRLKTMESHNETQIAKIGDYIIKGVQGEFYPCDAEVFAKTYERADEPILEQQD